MPHFSPFLFKLVVIHFVLVVSFFFSSNQYIGKFSILWNTQTQSGNKLIGARLGPGIKERKLHSKKGQRHTEEGRNGRWKAGKLYSWGRRAVNHEKHCDICVVSVMSPAQTAAQQKPIRAALVSLQNLGSRRKRFTWTTVNPAYWRLYKQYHNLCKKCPTIHVKE